MTPEEASLRGRLGAAVQRARHDPTTTARADGSAHARRASPRPCVTRAVVLN